MTIEEQEGSENQSFTLTLTPAEMGWLFGAARALAKHNRKQRDGLERKYGSEFDAENAEAKEAIYRSIRRKIKQAGWGC